jgi:hypothetical protein
MLGLSIGVEDVCDDAFEPKVPTLPALLMCTTV